jgi:hypothetical protein
MRKPPVLVALVPALALPAGACAATPAQVAKALERDPVVAERGADPGISPQEAGKIRIRIAERDIGRIKVAVVSVAMDEAAQLLERQTAS